MEKNIIGYLLFRVGISFLYLFAAYMNSKNKESIKWTIENTKVLYRGTVLAKNEFLLRVSTVIGLIIMYVGGISILLGLWPSLGASSLIVFTFFGTLIHKKLKADAFAQLSSTHDYASPLYIMASSAYAAHTANIFKNISLIFILAFIVLNGVGGNYTLNLYLSK